jgi:translation initiation factor 4G
MLALTDEHQRAIAERAVKKRTLGNMRLISELYKQDMVKDWIMCTCIEELLEKEKGKTLPPEDNIEVSVEPGTK